MKEFAAGLRTHLRRNVNQWKYRVKVLGEFEISHKGTRHLVWEVNCWTSVLETSGLMQEPVNREIIDFAQRLRNTALFEIINKGVEGLAAFPEMALPRAGEGGDDIEKHLTYVDLGKENPHYWRTQIPQLWIKRDPSDPIDLPRSIIGSYAVPLDVDN